VNYVGQLGTPTVCATVLVAAAGYLVVVAGLMGHSRLDTTGSTACPPNRTKPTRLTTSPPTTEVTNRRSGPYWAHQYQPMAGFVRISVVPENGRSRQCGSDERDHVAGFDLVTVNVVHPRCETLPLSIVSLLAGGPALRPTMEYPGGRLIQ
jgi:hypothetical protein